MSLALELPALGAGLLVLSLLQAAAALGTDRPWFAIGGVDESTLDQVLEAGARRVVVVRALTEAADPHAAARRLRSRLERG